MSEGEKELTNEEKGDIILEVGRRALERARLAKKNEPTQEDLKKEIEIRRKKFSDLKEEMETRFKEWFSFELDYKNVLFQGACRNGYQEKIQWEHHWKKMNKKLGNEKLKYHGYSYPLPETSIPDLPLEPFEDRSKDSLELTYSELFENPVSQNSVLLTPGLKDMMTNVILPFLDIYSILNFSVCSKFSHNLVFSSECLWENLVRRDFDLTSVRFSENENSSWRDFYFKTLWISMIPLTSISSYYDDQSLVVQDEIYRITEKKSNGSGGILVLFISISDETKDIFKRPKKEEEEEEPKEPPASPPVGKNEEEEEEEDKDKEKTTTTTTTTTPIKTDKEVFVMDMSKPNVFFSMRTNISGHTRRLICEIDGNVELLSHQHITSSGSGGGFLTTLKLNCETLVSVETSMFDSSPVDKKKIESVVYILEMFRMNNGDFVGVLKGFGLDQMLFTGTKNKKYDIEVFHKLYLKDDSYIKL